MGLAFAVALIVGLIVYKFVNSDQLKDAHAKHHGHSHENHGHDHHQHPKTKLIEVMGHTVSEFFDMGKYLLFGAFLVGLLQTFVARDDLIAVGHGHGSGTLVMMSLDSCSRYVRHPMLLLRSRFSLHFPKNRSLPSWFSGLC